MKNILEEYKKTLYMSELDGLNKEKVLNYFTENMPDGSKLDGDYGEFKFDVFIKREI